jgi:predicted RNase H-like HicB family nuclease
MSAPKIKLLYFKNVLDKCFYGFFEDFNDCFTRGKNGEYVLSGGDSSEKARKYITAAVKEELLKHAMPFDPLNPEYFFVIGGCNPEENLLLDFKDGYFPKKLEKLICSGKCPKYVLKEKDIKIDVEFFNSIIEDVFISLFAGRSGFKKLLGKKYDGVFAIRHRRLDCYSMFKVLKYVYGRSSCVNVWKDEFEDKRTCLVAVNDLICRYVNNKTAMNKSRELKKIVVEIRQYCDELINGIYDGKQGT